MRTDAAGGDLPDLPRTLYLDTQFLFAYMVRTDEDHVAAEKMADSFRELNAIAVTSCFVSILVLDELAWALAGPLYMREHGDVAWRRAGRREAFLSVREEVAAALADLLDEGWISLVSADAACAEAYPEFLGLYPLSPADSAHMAIAVTTGLDGIVTNDHHFHQLEDCPLEVVGYAAG